MFGLIDRCRVCVVLLALFAQVLGGFAVLCHEGSGGPVLEWLPGLCCSGGVTVAEDGTAPVDDQDSCGCCQDAPVAAVLQRQDDRARWELPAPVPADASTIPLVGSVVLVC